jgi:hypothetical protein
VLVDVIQTVDNTDTDTHAHTHKDTVLVDVIQTVDNTDTDTHAHTHKDTVLVDVIQTVDDVPHNLVARALILAARDLEAARLEDLYTDVGVALHA